MSAPSVLSGLRRSLPWCVGLLAACYSPAPVEPTVVSAPLPPAPSAKAGPATVSLTAVALPKRFVLDGRLDEWGDLRPPPGGEGVSPPEDFPLKSAIGQGKPRREAKNAHNPVDAVVRVGLAITEAGIHVAIDFGSAPPSPVTLGLASIDWQTLATTHDDDDSELTSYDDIVRRFTISPKGVELLGESRPLDGAEVVRASEGKTLEVFLPNRWMPRLVDALWSTCGCPPPWTERSTAGSSMSLGAG